jgi:hypothetical protein
MERFVEAFGTEDRDFVNGLAQQLIFVGARLNLDALSFMIAVIKDIRPNDQIEAMLAAQTQAAHALEKPTNATPALTDARQPAMEIIREPERAPVPARRRQKDDGQSSA